MPGTQKTTPLGEFAKRSRHLLLWGAPLAISVRDALTGEPIGTIQARSNDKVCVLLRTVCDLYARAYQMTVLTFGNTRLDEDATLHASGVRDGAEVGVVSVLRPVDIRFRVDVDYGDRESPFVPLTAERFAKALLCMRGKEECVLRTKHVTLVIDYPLTVVYKEELHAPEGAFTREALCLAVRKAYQRIYDEERETSTLREESLTDRIPGGLTLLNRASTNGKWGLKLHGLGDLDLYSLHYDPAENELIVEVDT